MIKLPPEIQQVLVEINNKNSPLSVFLYGSRARTDFVKDSDYEIGLLYKAENKISRSELANTHNVANLRLYPFDYDKFLENRLDTPFPKVIYMRSMIAKAKTLYGEVVVEKMEPPTITLLDLFEEAVFQISRCYSAMLSQREGDYISANAGFVKSSLFGVRTLIVLRKKVFPVQYDEIVEASKNIELTDEDLATVKHAIDVRNGEKLNVNMLYKNLSFLNQVVIKEIKDQLDLGNKIVI